MSVCRGEALVLPGISGRVRASCTGCGGLREGPALAQVASVFCRRLLGAQAHSSLRILFSLWLNISQN